MQLNNLHDVLAHEIEDLYSAEQQLVEALPTMADQASSTKLKEALESHLKQTEEHVSRLEEAAEKLDIELDGVVCQGMEGLLKEGSDLLEQNPSPALDAAMISAAQRVEHYEIAAYGSAAEFADKLGEKEVAKLLKATLKEEEKADEKLSKIAETEVNEGAMEMEEIP